MDVLAVQRNFRIFRKSRARTLLESLFLYSATPEYRGRIPVILFQASIALARSFFAINRSFLVLYAIRVFQHPSQNHKDRSNERIQNSNLDITAAPPAG